MARPDNSKEVFLPEHKWLEDGVLLAPPARGPLTPLTLFVCTYVAKLGNLHVNFVELTALMCADPHGVLIALNSNFGHACQPGFEHLLKAPKPPPERRVPARGRARKVQGDGTCFNSAVEPILAVDHPGISDDKIYKVKCFPTTGETQVPGVICPDLSDGRAVLDAFVAYLNELGVGDEEPAAAAEEEHIGAGAPEPRRRLEITIISEQPKMLNYKFRVNRNAPRILVNLRALATYMHSLELTKAVEGTPLTEAQAARFVGWPAVLLPPYPVRETKPPTDDVKVSFRFRGADRAPRINIFQEGKINILGADSVESARKIYDFFVQLFTDNWAMLVCLQPRRDLERRQAARAPRPVAAPVPPPVRLTDTEVDALLADVLGTADELRAGQARVEEKRAELSEAQAATAATASELAFKLGNVRLLGSLAEPPVAEVLGAAVRNIVADLDEWGFDEDEEDGEPEEEDEPEEDGEPEPSGAVPAGLDMQRTLESMVLVRGRDALARGEPAVNAAFAALLAENEDSSSDAAAAELQGALQDVVLGEVDREDVEDYEEDPL
jgi:hypothetical protein